MATRRSPQSERLVACPDCHRLFSLETLFFRNLDSIPPHADQRDMLSSCAGSGTLLAGLPLLRSTQGPKAS